MNKARQKIKSAFIKNGCLESRVVGGRIKYPGLEEALNETDKLLDQYAEQTRKETVNNIQKLLLLHSNLEVHLDGNEIMLVDKDKFKFKEGNKPLESIKE